MKNPAKRPNNFYLGKLLKQGPAIVGNLSGLCDDECRKEDSNHWATTHLFSTVPLDYDFFYTYQEMADSYLKNKKFASTNMFLTRYYEGGYNEAFGRKYFIKKCPDPMTDVIVKTHEVTSDDEIHDMARDVFGYEIKEKVSIFKNNRLNP